MSDYDASAKPARFTVKKVFRSTKIGNIYACLVDAGTVRSGDLFHEGPPEPREAHVYYKPASLRRFNEEVSEVQAGYEFGFTWLGGRGPELKEGDVITAVEVTA